MYACSVYAYVSFISLETLGNILWLQTLYSFERIAEMFDISKPRKPSGTAKLAKLSRERAGGGQAWAKSSLAVIQD